MPVIDSDRLLDDPRTMVEPRIAVMLAILFVSLFAVSFPAISKKISFLRIPHLVFFIGKHFGTGVILSTAFCHLLPDAFGSLQDLAVQRRYHGIGKWTGMIILSALLAIFLIEYSSTTYVDHLHAKSSAPPSPVSSRPPSLQARQPQSSSSKSPPPNPVAYPTPVPTAAAAVATIPTPLSETTPLLPRSHTCPHPDTPHHRKRTKSLGTEDKILLPLILLNSPRLQHAGLVWRDVGYVCPAAGRTVLPGSGLAGLHFPRLSVGGEGGGSERVEGKGKGKDRGEERDREGASQKFKIGRKRQVIGILVLQLGIMIHSFVIGLTLAVTSGSDFMSLVTAITFHQLFEGLSLGIRIAALPPPSPSPSPPLPSAPSPSSSPRLPSRTSSSSSSPWSRTPSPSSSPPDLNEPQKLDWLNPTLSILFAVTTPVGMAIGMGAFWHAHPGTSPDQTAQMNLTQGLLSAISAGMLIYAATVEMLAGDFVFGDVAGDHHDGHGHGHGHDHGFSGDSDSDSGGKHTGTGMGRRVLAVVSLLAGVAGMGLVGLGE